MPSAAFPPELQLLVFQFAVDKASQSSRALRKLLRTMGLVSRVGLVSASSLSLGRSRTSGTDVQPLAPQEEVRVRLFRDIALQWPDHRKNASALFATIRDRPELGQLICKLDLAQCSDRIASELCLVIHLLPNLTTVCGLSWPLPASAVEEPDSTRRPALQQLAIELIPTDETSPRSLRSLSACFDLDSLHSFSCRWSDEDEAGPAYPDISLMFSEIPQTVKFVTIDGFYKADFSGVLASLDFRPALKEAHLRVSTSDFEPWLMPEPLDKELHPLLLFPSLRTLTFQHMIPVSLFYVAIEHKRLETLHIGMPQHRHESPPTPEYHSDDDSFAFDSEWYDPCKRQRNLGRQGPVFGLGRTISSHIARFPSRFPRLRSVGLPSGCNNVDTFERLDFSRSPTRDEHNVAELAHMFDDVGYSMRRVGLGGQSGSQTRTLVRQAKPFQVCFASGSGLISCFAFDSPIPDTRVRPVAGQAIALPFVGLSPLSRSLTRPPISMTLARV